MYEKASRPQLRRALLLALTGIIGSACSRLASPDRPSVDVARVRGGAREPLVVFLGDSLSAGLYLPPEHAFPVVAQRSLSSAGVPFVLVNAAVSGDSSEGGLLRLPALLAQKPEVVVIALGADDGLRQLSVAALSENLRSILAAVKQSGATPLLLGIRLPLALVGRPYGERFAAVFPALADDLEVLFVPSLLDGVGGEPQLNLDDGLHPNPRGHARLAENIAPSLREALSRARARHPGALAESETAGVMPR